MKHLADTETSRRLCWPWQDGLPSGLKDSTQSKCWSLRLCSKTGRVNTRISQKSGKFSRLNWGDKQLLNLRSVKKQGILSVCALVHFVPCPWFLLFPYRVGKALYFPGPGIHSLLYAYFPQRIIMF